MRKKKRVHGSGGVCDRVHSRVRRWIGLDGWFNSSQWLGKGKFNSFYLTYSLKPQQVGSQVPIEDSGLEDEEWPGMKMVSLFVGQTVRSIRIQTPPCSITSCSVWRKGILASKLENIRWWNVLPSIHWKELFTNWGKIHGFTAVKHEVPIPRVFYVHVIHRSVPDKYNIISTAGAAILVSMPYAHNAIYSAFALRIRSETIKSTISSFNLPIISLTSTSLPASARTGCISPAKSRLLSSSSCTAVASLRERTIDDRSCGVYNGARCSSDNVNDRESLCRIASSWKRGRFSRRGNLESRSGGEGFVMTWSSNTNSARNWRYRH